MIEGGRERERERERETSVMNVWYQVLWPVWWGMSSIYTRVTTDINYMAIYLSIYEPLIRMPLEMCCYVDCWLRSQTVTAFCCVISESFYLFLLIYEKSIRWTTHQLKGIFDIWMRRRTEQIVIYKYYEFFRLSETRKWILTFRRIYSVRYI